MRIASSTGLLLASLTILAACGDDGDATTSTGSGGAGSSSDTSSTSSGTGDATSSASGSDTASGAGGGDGGAGGEGTGGTGGEAPLEVIEGPGFRSGSRLRPVYLDGGDGARKLLHWYDLDLGLPCRLQEDTAAGDTYTCVPMGAGARIAFTDDGCTDPVMVVTDDGCDDRFDSTSTDVEAVFASATTLRGRGTLTVHERGDELEALQVYERAAGACEALELEADERVHAVVAPTIALVTATRDVESLGDGLARAVAHGEDGSMQIMGPFHEDSATACQYLVRATAGGSMTCTPAVVPEFASATQYPPSGAIHYADDGCSLPAASLFTAELAAVLPDYVVGPSEVQGEIIAYARGEELDFGYSTHTGECAAYPNVVRDFAVGPPLDVTFPHVFYFDVAGERVRSSVQGSAGGELASTAYGFIDTTYGEVCRPYVFEAENEDGTAPTRCVAGTKLPDAGTAFPIEGEFFADEDCTDALVEFSGGVAYRLRAVLPPACSQLPAPDEVTEAVLFASHDGPVFQRWGDGCRAYQGNGHPEHFSRHVRRLTPEDFAIVTLVDPASAP